MSVVVSYNGIIKLTSGTWFCEQSLHYDVVRSLIGHSRVLHQFLLDSNADIVLRQQSFQLFECLRRNKRLVVNQRVLLYYKKKNRFN